MTSSRAVVLVVVAALVVLASSAGAHPPCGIVVDKAGRIFFPHGPTNRIHRIDPDGTLRVHAEGSEARGPLVPHHLVLDPAGNLYTASDRGGEIWKISPAGEVARWYPAEGGVGAGFPGAGGNPFTIDGAGNLYAAHQGRDEHCVQILRIEPCGAIREFAGGPRDVLDGPRERAGFRDLHGAGMAWAIDGPLLVTDDGTRVRRIAMNGEVRTLAGGQEPGFADGHGGDARFRDAMGLCAGPDGSVYVADMGNRRIRRVTKEGDVTTIAGTGQPGHADGPALEATFDEPSGVALDPAGNVVILEAFGRDRLRVRRLSPDGRVSTLASTP